MLTLRRSTLFLFVFLAACADNRARPRFDAGPPPPSDSGSLPGDDGGPLPEVDSSVPPFDGGGLDAGPIDRCAGVNCSSLDTSCRMGVCDPSTGACTTIPRSGSCEDGDNCTTGDFCSSGACQPGSPLDCSSFDGECAVGECDPSSGSCRAAPVTNGTPCSGSSGECSTSSCQTGVCTSVPAADCTSCSTGVCAGGACGSAPTTLDYGFETGLPSGWTTAATTNGWSVDATRLHGGVRAAHSGVTGHSATSTLSTSVSLGGSGTLSFWLYTSSESGYDYLEVWVDGVRGQRWSGTTAWTQHTQALSAGRHTIEWRYTKDGSGAVGDDRVWIDDVRVQVGGSSAEGFETGVLPSGYTTSISPSWVVDTTLAHAGSYSMHSGIITHSQSTGVQRSVTVSGTSSVSFWYSVSSESGYDWLHFYIDSVEQDAWSGAVSWTQATFPLTSGTHTLEWRYTKDGTVTAGSDRAWVDDVQVGAGALCAP